MSNELEIEPKNYPLLLFAASKSKFRRFLDRIVSEDDTIYLYYAHFMDYELTEEVLAMAGKQDLYQKNLQRIAKDLLSVINKDEILKQMTLEDLARGLSAKEQLSRLNNEEQARLHQLLQKLIENN